MANIFLSVFIVIFLLPNLSWSDSALLKMIAIKNKASKDVICLECHGDLVDPVTINYLHYPAADGACNLCHTVRDDHLQGDNPPGSVVSNASAEGCYRCHDRKDDYPVKHGILNDPKGCVRCHNPHGSYTRYLLQSTSIVPLCTTCHNTAITGKSWHGPITKGQACIVCHAPHSAVEEKLLRKPSKQLCLSCHNKDIRATVNDTRLIPNIDQKLKLAHPHPGASTSDSLCVDCHRPHASSNLRLLNAGWSTKIYNTYSEVNGPYDICFTCHDRKMMAPTDYVTETNFRDDDRQKNLHWFHVVDAAGSEDKSRGRACKICHDPHGAAQSHDVNDTWMMNSSPIPLEYTATSVGGQCTRSCHSVKFYQRR